MSRAFAEAAEAPPVTEAQVRARASDLIALAARHGISALAFASPGRLRGKVDAHHDLFDVFEFQRAASEMLGATVALFSEGALANANVSPDLESATAL